MLVEYGTSVSSSGFRVLQRFLDILLILVVGILENLAHRLENDSLGSHLLFNFEYLLEHLVLQDHSDSGGKIVLFTKSFSLLIQVGFFINAHGAKTVIP